MSNRLSMERSPYLLQHAENPVDWRPWGPEVFEEAKDSDKPIFLSIGYSTDARWLVPHFEKMLYDNALLALTYMEAFQLTRRPLYEQIVRRALNYVLRELSGPQGGFYPYASDGEQLLTRTKEAYDGAMPSGNSAAALVLSRLSRLTWD